MKRKIETIVELGKYTLKYYLGCTCRTTRNIPVRSAKRKRVGEVGTVSLTEFQQVLTNI